MVSEITQGTATELQQRRADLASKLERLNKTLSDCQVEAQSLARSISLIDHELTRRLRPAIEPRVSDHALLRFIERVMGVDIEALRARVLTPAISDAVKAGASAVTVEGVKFVVSDNVIVTTLGTDQRLKPKTRKHAREVQVDALKEGLEEYFEARAE